MPLIKDLSASQLARHASNVFLFQGRHVIGGRLLYHALVLNPREGEALHGLSDFHDHEGTQELSAVVMEYALAPETGLSEPERTLIDATRFRAIWSWGFSRHDSGQTNLGLNDFQDRSRFRVDQDRYKAFMEPVIQLGGSHEGAFRGAHTMAGAMSGLLVHRQHGRKSSFEEIFHPDRYERTPLYEEWLREETTDLDALERSRQDRVRTARR